MKQIVRLAKWILPPLSIWLAAASPSLASIASPGQVASPLVGPNGFVIFYTTGTRSGDPACDTNGRWGFDATTAGGQALLSMLMTAFATGRTITVYGSNYCTVAGQEDISYFVIN